MTLLWTLRIDAVMVPILYWIFRQYARAQRLARMWRAEIVSLTANADVSAKFLIDAPEELPGKKDSKKC